MKVVWSDRAIRDLMALRAWLAERNPRAASRIASAIRHSVSHLAQTPHIGRPGRAPHTRELIVGTTPYIVAYSVSENSVLVLAVIHSSRQWPESF